MNYISSWYDMRPNWSLFDLESKWSLFDFVYVKNVATEDKTKNNTKKIITLVLFFISYQLLSFLTRIPTNSKKCNFFQKKFKTTL